MDSTEHALIHIPVNHDVSQEWKENTILNKLIAVEHYCSTTSECILTLVNPQCYLHSEIENQATKESNNHGESSTI